MMKATAGDRLVIPGRHVSDRVRSGEIVEVHGPDGSPPYLVRWAGQSEPVLIFPGPDAHVEHAVPAQSGSGPADQQGPLSSQAPDGPPGTSS
jgi:hypothetical protein